VNINHRLAISYYRTIAVINEPHKVFLVQHIESNQICIKKILDVYNINVYEELYNNPIAGTPEILHFSEENNQLIVIEEYISGHSLTEKISNHELTAKTILSYTVELCAILEKLHSMNPPVIHRDIKPSNIMIDSNDHVIILDFNAAKQYSDKESRDTVLLGTQGYAAPEQYGFGYSSVQTDIYSLGIVLKEMAETIDNPMNSFEKIIEKCTQINPADRYANTGELNRDLIRLLQSGCSSSENDEKTGSHSCRSKAGTGINSKRVKADGDTDSGPGRAGIGSDSERDRINKTHNRKHFLPPGFRTGTPWKIFTAIIGYLFILMLCLTLKVENAASVTVLWIDRFSCLLIFLSWVFVGFDYLNIRRLMPLCSSKTRCIRYSGTVLLMLILTVIIFSAMVIIENTLFNI